MDKKQALITLYAKCLESNYTDMSDENQKLKVKVFAMDLGLKYKKIENLFEEAKAEYEFFQRNQENKAKLKKQQEAADKVRQAMEEKAELVFTVSIYNGSLREGQKPGTIDVYRCEDGSVFCRRESLGKSSYGLRASVKSAVISQYTYHPSKTIFTGAASGGVAMGGFHETKAYYTSKDYKTGKGEVVFHYDNSSITVRQVILSGKMTKLFSRTKAYKEAFCWGSSADCHFDPPGYMIDAAARTPDPEQQNKLMQVAMDEAKISIEKCCQIADMLNDIISNDLPEQDESIYQKAVIASETKDFPHLSEAVKRFEYIIDYKDSKARLNEIKPLYEKLLQEEKEKEVLRREENAKKKKTKMTVVLAVLVIAVIIAGIGYMGIQKNMSYEIAVSHMESDRYDDALKAFTKLGDYKDSAALLERVKENMYAEAVEKAENAEHSEAFALFEELGDYKDSLDIVNQMSEDIKEYEELYSAENITDDIVKRAVRLLEKSKYISDSDFEAKVFRFANLCDTEWKYSSGDPLALSMVLKKKGEHRTLNTTMYREYGWGTKNLQLKDGKEKLVTLGVTSRSSVTYGEKGQVTMTEKGFSGFDISVILHTADEMEIIVEKSDGKVYKCRYVKVK